ncbi:GNAT family N-acetyltransferase [Methanococcoides orientis]|uniref:GNAT family N-acetyltransferase n=1 Tax=Methanococcoides orientis TaxID=2822137 RepID=UPI001E4CB695|nr:GNAT family N-acetyltransferase [Methanococcoides orientis]UGV39840.1 GNAT family N-acetyltransferase [Methanococcoides orientis]
MNKEEVSFAIEMASSEGWNPGIHDGEIFYDTDPKGFFIAEMNGEFLGSASAVAYDNSYGFMGFYVVRPECRDKGIGMLLTNACLTHLGHRTIGLDGVVENEIKYRDRMGFRTLYSNLRYEGTGGGDIPDGITNISDVPFDDLVEYDSRMFFCKRPYFLRSWVRQNESNAFAVLDNGTIKGYGVIRKCFEGYKMGPLFADDHETAQKLFSALKSSAGNEKFYLDIPEPNKNAVSMAEDEGMSIVFKTVRMYKNGKPELPLESIYGVTSFELG